MSFFPSKFSSKMTLENFYQLRGYFDTVFGQIYCQLCQRKFLKLPDVLCKMALELAYENLYQLKCILTHSSKFFSVYCMMYEKTMGLMQCVAVCCSVLQCVAVCCSVLQCVAVCCNVLQYVAVCFWLSTVCKDCESDFFFLFSSYF